MSTNVVHISGVIVGVFVFLISLISFLAMLTSRPDGVDVLSNIFEGKNLTNYGKKCRFVFAVSLLIIIVIGNIFGDKP